MSVDKTENSRVVGLNVIKAGKLLPFINFASYVKTLLNGGNRQLLE